MTKKRKYDGPVNSGLDLNGPKDLASSSRTGITSEDLSSLLLGDVLIDPKSSKLFDPSYNYRRDAPVPGQDMSRKSTHAEQLPREKRSDTISMAEPAVIIAGDQPSSQIKKFESQRKPRHRKLLREQKDSLRSRHSEKSHEHTIPSDIAMQDQKKALRTLFVGNVPLTVATKAKEVSKLKAFLLQSSEVVDDTCELLIESVRFRSIAFAMPTEASDDQNSRKKRKTLEEPVEHTPELSGSDAKRLAFIRREFHASAGDRCNAYVVFKLRSRISDKDATPNQGGEAIKTEQDLSAEEAAKLHGYLASIVRKGNGASFGGHTLRIDWIFDTRSAAGVHTSEKPSGRDVARTIFVGSVDFAAREDDLQSFFEGLLSETFGASISEDPWVDYVRIVRDPGTMMGKGFAYVMLRNRQCVDALLSLEASALRMNKRKLRLERCKPQSGSRSAAAKSSPAKGSKIESNEKHLRSGKDLQHVSVPKSQLPARSSKGIAELAEKLRGLSKEERKAVKAQDELRVTRRLAKKKNKGINVQHHRIARK